MSMCEQASAAGKAPLAAELVYVLLAGALSMFFAEALSGSSILWFATDWAWIITFWLYLAHFLLFINLALVFRRTSLTSLYLWGVLFGLYESWITKVTWAGYFGSAPGFGTFLGFAIPEFPLIVFFWHPVFSFILPALCFEALSGRSRILPLHQRFLAKTPRNGVVSLAVVFIGATFLPLNADGNIPIFVLTIAGSIAIIGALYWIASNRYGRYFSIESLRLGKKGMHLLVTYLVLLYSVGFLFIIPEGIAPPLTILLTLGVYAVVMILLYLKKPDGITVRETSPYKQFFGLKDLSMLLGALTIIGVVFCLLIGLLPEIAYLMAAVLYIALVAISPVLFALAVLSTWRGRRKTKAMNIR